MERRNSSRRTFLQTSLTTLAAVGAYGIGLRFPASARASVRKCLPIRLGGPAFADTQDPEELALAHRKLGYSAAYCPGISLKDSARIRAVADAFAKHDVV